MAIETCNEEIEYQKNRASTIRHLKPTPVHVFERYRKLQHPNLFMREYLFKKLGNLHGKRVLDFGCGEGDLTTLLAGMGAKVTGVDISPDLIRLAKEQCRLDGTDKQVRFEVRDLSEKPFKKDSFDFVVCNTVLHHVDIKKILPNIIESLCHNGVVIMVEPVAFLPWLQRIRDLAPVEKDISPEERQLGEEDLRYISGCFRECHTTYFQFLARLEVFLPHHKEIDHGHPVTKALMIGLTSVDRFLINCFPILWRFYGNVVMVGRK